MPMGNKACNERHVRKCQDLHRQQLATVKSTIDNGPPKSTKKGALTTNAKKQQIMVSPCIMEHCMLWHLHVHKASHLLLGCLARTHSLCKCS
jgi:hypothetical protein